MSISLIIDNDAYFIDDKVKILEAVCIEKSYILLENKRKIGFFNYKGEVLSVVGKKDGSSTNILVTLYKNLKFGLIFDDISENNKESVTPISKLIEELIDA